MYKKIFIFLFVLLALFACYQVEHSIYRSNMKTYADYIKNEESSKEENTQDNNSNMKQIQNENDKAVLNQEQTEEADVKKTAYLTFDDGPSDVTREIIEVLDQYKIKATFFLIAGQITDEKEDIVKELVEKGHTIGIHTYSHKRKEIYSSVDACLDDFEKAYDRIYELTNIKPTVYRFPYGSQNVSVCNICKEVMEKMEEKGLVFYDWNVDSRDFSGSPSEYSILKNISLFSKYNEPVIIMHDSKKNKITAKVLPQVIERIKSAGYEFDTVENRSEPCQYPHDWRQ